VPCPLLVASAALAAAIVASRAFETARPSGAPFAAIEIGLGSLWALAALCGAARVAPRVLALVVACVAAACAAPEHARAALLAAHNVVAIAAWLAIFRRRLLGAALVPVALLALGALWLICTHHALGAFVLLQSAHYAVWLRAIPEESARGEGALTFRMGARALARDLGARGVALSALLTVLVLAAAFINPHWTLRVYLACATFHVYLEIAMLAFVASRGAALEEGSSWTSRTLRSGSAPSS
jgi:hypothetical protein